MTYKRLTPIQAIKRYCKHECCVDDLKSWKECTRQACPLFSYRLGKRPIKQPFEEYCKPKQADLTRKSEENRGESYECRNKTN